MASKIASIGIQSIFGINVFHESGVGIHVFPCLGVGLVKVLCKHQKVLESSFLKQSHQVARQSLAFIGGNFGNLSTFSHDITSFNTFKLKVSRNSSMDK